MVSGFSSNIIHKPLPGYDFALNKIGNKYVAYGGRKYRPISYSDLSTTWAEVKAAKPGPATEWANHQFTVDAPLEIEDYGTIVRGQAGSKNNTMFYLANGVNDDAWRLKPGVYACNVTLEDFLIMGNKDNNNAGRGLDWNVTVAATVSPTLSRNFSYMLRMENVVIFDCKNEGLYIRTTTGDNVVCRIRGGSVSFNGGDAQGYQIRLVRYFDSEMDNIHTNSMRLVASGASNVFSHLYLGGGINNLLLMEGGESAYQIGGNLWDTCRIDHAYGVGIKMVDYCRRNIFTGCAVTNPMQGMASDTYPAISIGANCTDNTFDGGFIGHTNIVTTDRWTYALEEVGNATLNKALGVTIGHGAVGVGQANHFTRGEFKFIPGSGSFAKGSYRGKWLPRVIR